MERCIPYVLEEGTAEDTNQAVAYCASIWEDEKGFVMTGQKVFRAPVELKADGDDGTFRAVFARLNVIDHDGDVIRPGAFQEGQEVVVEGWNHDYGLPPGKGVIHSSDEEAWIDGRFFLDTTIGKDHYLTLKNLEGIEEWSFTFNIEEAKNGQFEGEDVRFLDRLDTWGAAPVTRGAGIGTRTVALKSAAGLTGDEIRRIKAMLKDDDNEGESEGEAGDAGKPSGVSPSVILTEIEIMGMED